MVGARDFIIQAKEFGFTLRRWRIANDSWHDWTLDNAYSEELAFQVEYLNNVLEEQARQFNSTLDAIIKEEE